MPRIDMVTYQRIAVMNSSLNRVIAEALTAKVQISGQFISHSGVGRYVDEKA